MMILCTIHQPTWVMIEMFDQLLVLERGTVVYRDSPEKFCHYFKEQRHDLLIQSQQLQRLSQDSLSPGAPTPKGETVFEEYATNPMDYFFECLAADPTRSLWAEQWTKVAMGPDGFKKSDLEDSSEFQAAPSKRILGPFCQMCVLFKRATYMFTKTRSGLTLTTVANIVLNFLTGIAFFDVGFKSSGILMGNGVFCIISATWLASTMITVVSVQALLLHAMRPTTPRPAPYPTTPRPAPYPTTPCPAPWLAVAPYSALLCLPLASYSQMANLDSCLMPANSTTSKSNPSARSWQWQLQSLGLLDVSARIEGRMRYTDWVDLLPNQLFPAGIHGDQVLKYCRLLLCVGPVCLHRPDYCPSDGHHGSRCSGRCADGDCSVIALQ